MRIPGHVLAAKQSGAQTTQRFSTFSRFSLILVLPSRYFASTCCRSSFPRLRSLEFLMKPSPSLSCARGSEA
jgi:hypothetical protein